VVRVSVESTMASNIHIELSPGRLNVGVFLVGSASMGQEVLG
jgi:hypothetical protein